MSKLFKNSFYRLDFFCTFSMKKIGTNFHTIEKNPPKSRCGKRGIWIIHGEQEFYKELEKSTAL